ncbi:Integrase core domain protein [compost metagenome]
MSREAHVRFCERLGVKLPRPTYPYVWAQGRWHYLAAVLDLHTRRMIGWAFSAKPDAELVIKALDMAYEQRGKPQQVLFHSDPPSTPVACFGNGSGVTGCSRA